MVDFKWCPTCRNRVWSPQDVCTVCQGATESIPIPSEQDTLRTGVCPKCHSHNIIPDWPLELPDTSFASGNRAKVRIAAQPSALFKRKTEVREVRTWICGTCGYVELFVDGAEGLWEAYQQGHAQKRNTQSITPPRQCEQCHNIVAAEALFCEQCGGRLSSAGKATERLKS